MRCQTTWFTGISLSMPCIRMPWVPCIPGLPWLITRTRQDSVKVPCLLSIPRQASTRNQNNHIRNVWRSVGMMVLPGKSMRTTPWCHTLKAPIGTQKSFGTNRPGIGSWRYILPGTDSVCSGPKTRGPGNAFRISHYLGSVSVRTSFLWPMNQAMSSGFPGGHGTISAVSIRWSGV